MLNKEEQFILDIIVDLRKRKERPNFEMTKEVIQHLISKDENGNILTNYNLVESGNRFLGMNRIQFLPDNNTINLAMKNFFEWIDLQCADFINNNDISTKNRNELYNYLYFLIILHEIKHSQQYLIAFNQYECDYEVLRSVYKYLLKSVMKTDYHIKLYGIIKKIIYKKNENKMSLERNAHTLTFQNLTNIAKYDYSLPLEINQFLNDCYVNFLFSGYHIQENGNITNTIETSLRLIGETRNYGKLDFSNDITLINRLTYGMIIDIESYQQIKELFKKHQNNPIELKEKIYYLSSK